MLYGLQNRGHVGRSRGEVGILSSIALSPGSEVPMSLVHFFARGETLAISSQCALTDGASSGVAKNNPHQYTKALWQRMVPSCLSRCLHGDVATPERGSRTKRRGYRCWPASACCFLRCCFWATRTQATFVGTDHASDEQGADAGRCRCCGRRFDRFGRPCR